MDAVCAKVDAANRVTLLFNSSLNFIFFFNLTSWRHPVADLWHRTHRPMPRQSWLRYRGKCEQDFLIGDLGRLSATLLLGEETSLMRHGTWRS